MNQRLLVSLLGLASVLGITAAHGCGLCEAGWGLAGAALEGFRPAALAAPASQPSEKVQWAVTPPTVQAVTATGPSGQAETHYVINLPQVQVGPAATQTGRFAAGVVDIILAALAALLGGTSIVLVYRGGKWQRISEVQPPTTPTPTP